MSAASWYRLSKRALTAVLSHSGRRKSLRQPAHSRPSLESLEERIVPDGASGNLGIVNTGAVNFQGGITLVPLPAQELSGIAVGLFQSPFNASGALELAQFGLNLPSNVSSFNQTAFGFGSGTQPGQPWVPNAYNLGLANQQGAYPTLADRGFQAPPPWVRQIAHLQEKNADTDPDEQAAPPRTFLAVKEAAEDDNQAAEISADEAAGDSREERIDPDDESTLPTIPLVPHAATETNDAMTAADAQARATKPATLEATPPWHVRGEDATIDEALLAGKLEAPEAAVPQENGFSEARSAVWTEEQSFREIDGPQEVPALESLNLPSAVLLSVLTPAQMMTLLVDFPAADASEGRDEEACLTSLGNEE
jgi:hypothetical protein